LSGIGWQLTVDDGGVVLYDLDLQKMQRFTTRGGSVYPPCWGWSPDGTRILYNDFENSGEDMDRPHQHRITNMLTGQTIDVPRWMADDVETNDCLIRWHPQGKAVLVGRILIDPEDGGYLGEISKTFGEYVMRASWSPDGDKLAFTTGSGLIHIAEVQIEDAFTGMNKYCKQYPESGYCMPLAIDNMSGIIDLHFSPIEDTLAILTETDIFLYQLSSNTLINLSKGFWQQRNLVVGGYALTWSPDGQKIAFYTYQPFDIGMGNPQVFVMNADGSGVSEITGGEHPYGSAPAWSPDGQWVYYSEWHTRQIVASKLDGSERLLLPSRIQGFALGFRPWKAGSTIAETCNLSWSRLEVGKHAEVTEDSPTANRVRSEPVIGENVIAMLGPGMISKVIEGPVCVDEYAFWKVENSTIPGGSGWTAEGDGKDYWLAPYGTTGMIASPTPISTATTTATPKPTTTPTLKPTLAPTTSSAAATWSRLSITAPTPWRGMTIAFDANRKVVVLFGGTGETGMVLNETWEFDGKSWSKIATAHMPPARFWHGMAYDAARSKVVLFGGWQTDNGGALSDTWEYDGKDWTQIQTANPGARGYGPGMVYDTCRKKVVLFGGAATSGDYYGDTWEYDGTSWKKVATQNAPSKRGLTAMAFDSTRCVTVLFGGINNGVGYNDTWEYNGVNWSKIAIATAPAARWAHALTYDSLLGQVLLFGGYTPATNKQVNDTWVYDGQGWVKLTPTTSPSIREQHVLAFDGSRVLLYGGYGSRETWQFK
jgi:hypothetical protein